MLILASESPRRRELLARLGVPFSVSPAKVEELDRGRDLKELPEKNALLKAEAAAEKFPDAFVLGADTGVFARERMLGKPASPEEAFEMLSFLSGTTHEVITGVALVCRRKNLCRSWSETSRVTFKKLTAAEIRSYMEQVCVADKAGAYAIQEHPELLGARWEGEMENIIGLPLLELEQILKEYEVS